MLAINCQPVRLPIWPVPSANIGPLVPIHTEPLEIIDELVFETCFAAIDISVFNAENHGAALLAGEQPVEQCGARIADVKMAGRRRGKTYADFRVRSGISGHKKMLAEGCYRGSVYVPHCHPERSEDLRSLPHEYQLH